MNATLKECPNHEGAFDCTPFCEICEGKQEIPDHHTHPVVLVKELSKQAPQNLGAWVSYEFPGIWDITVNHDTFLLGDANGFFSWHSEDGLISGDDIPATRTAEEIARAFWAWYVRNGVL